MMMSIDPAQGAAGSPPWLSTSDPRGSDIRPVFSYQLIPPTVNRVPPSRPLSQTADFEALYVSNLKLIDQVCSSICGRNGVYGEEAEEFNAEVRLKLLDHDYTVFRKFRNKSTIATYLTSVISNLFRDYRIKKWGRWRPSAKARRAGRTAVLLETLISRDGYSQDEALTILRQRGVTSLSRAKLGKIAATLPMRPRRRIESEDALARLAGPEQTNGAVIESERASAVESAEETLRSALATLPDEDQVIIKLQYFEGFSVADVARALHLEQKPLYERIKKNLKRLRPLLEQQGVTAKVLELMP